MRQSEATPLPAAGIDPATRLIHLALVLFGLAALLSGQFADDYKRAAHPGFTIHGWTGIGMALALGVRLLWGLVGPRAVRFSQWVPVTRQRLGYVAEDVGWLLRLRMPHRATHEGLAGLVQFAGLIAFAWMAATGAVMFYALEPGARTTGWLHLVKELHEAGQGAVIAYLALHGGAVVLHAFTGDDGWRRMLFLRTRAPDPSRGLVRTGGGDDA